jgi:hypothetical protein
MNLFTPIRDLLSLSRKAISALFAMAVVLLSCTLCAQFRDGQHSVSAVPYRASGPSGMTASGFAMADFTGDTHPDVATAELDRFDSPSAHYSIEIQLSEGGHQSLSLTAPFGGLLITPKDVTGDGNLDLIVRSAPSHVPVAVLLNDGQGHFSLVAPSAFAQVLREAPYQLAARADQAYFSATLISPEPYTLTWQNVSIRNPRLQGDVMLPATFSTSTRLLLSFGSNRAPPVVV